MKKIFFLLFFISGFSGLIYESIWTHYLKLFLGHSAYAQTLVLAIYMGGMAIGAALCSRLSMRWPNLLLAYALAEGVIGLFALFFHQIFETATQFTFLSLLPSVGNPSLALTLKWALAALLILPQSILLGMTFPLMSGGLLRRFPEQPGATLGMLYFSNSLGAAIGVLTSAFFLIQVMGLPGTIMTAGMINIVLALIVWSLARHNAKPLVAFPSQTTQATTLATPWLLFLLFTALFTGLASFLYEIGWIRMLSLVLGSSTHSFELMLSTFILGLALGGLWVRRHADAQKEPMRLLGLVQIWMGIFALGTLLVYGFMFDAMGFIFRVLQHTEEGYSVFLFASILLSLALMLPATFCAGMTLPLITKILLSRSYGEKSIGAVYASNTLGALLGIFLAVHIAMPLLGLKGLISVGAGIDILLGLMLLGVTAKKRYQPLFIGMLCLSVGVLAVSLQMIELDQRKMASGVFRYGRSIMAEKSSVEFYQDGKTSTVNIVRSKNGTLSLSNNGKADAAIQMDPTKPPSQDEYTTILLGALPLLFQQHPQTAAVIGMGSGQTTHTLLASPTLQQVDTIEIEAAVIEASKHFLPKNALAYDDPRSKIHVEDAKSFFSLRNTKYDIIVSEPPNPWVSGVANLFTQEFYQMVTRYLHKDGIFVQWVQLYEIDTRLVAMIFNAMESSFSDYRVFSSNGWDIIIVSTTNGILPPLMVETLESTSLQKQLQPIGINSLQDLKLHEIADKAVLAPLFNYISPVINSDYFPALDNQAPKARFLRANASNLARLRNYALPIIAILQKEATLSSHSPFSQGSYQRKNSLIRAQRLGKYLSHQEIEVNLLGKDRGNARFIRLLATECTKTDLSFWAEITHNLMLKMLPYLSFAEMEAVLQRLEASHCLSHLPESEPYNTWIQLYQAIAQRNIPAMRDYAKQVLHNNVGLGSSKRAAFALNAAMLGEYMSGHPEQAQILWEKWRSRTGSPSLSQMLLLSRMR